MIQMIASANCVFWVALWWIYITAVSWKPLWAGKKKRSYSDVFDLEWKFEVSNIIIHPFELAFNRSRLFRRNTDHTLRIAVSLVVFHFASFNFSVAALKKNCFRCILDYSFLALQVCAPLSWLNVRVQV